MEALLNENGLNTTVAATANQPLYVKDILHNALNYVGGKGDLISQILPHFPSNINKFHDVFGGAFTAGINVRAKFKVYNELDANTFSVIQAFSLYTPQENFAKVQSVLEKYNLTELTLKNPKNIASYEKLIKDFNDSTTKRWEMYYVISILAHSSNVHSKTDREAVSGFNGDRNFNENLQAKFMAYAEELYTNETVEYSNEDYSYINDVEIVENDFFYFDPPYLISNAGNCAAWTKEDEETLLDTLNSLHAKGAKFALSNVFEHKGLTNQILKDWAKNKDYTVTILNKEYNLSKDKENKTIEVLITNYSTTNNQELLDLYANAQTIVQGQALNKNEIEQIKANSKLADTTSVDAEEFFELSTKYGTKSLEAKFITIQCRIQVGLELLKLKARCEHGSFSKERAKTGLSPSSSEMHMRIARDTRIVALKLNKLSKIRNITYTKLDNMSKLTRDEDFKIVLNGDDSPLKAGYKPKKINPVDTLFQDVSKSIAQFKKDFKDDKDVKKAQRFQKYIDGFEAYDASNKAVNNIPTLATKGDAA